MKWYVPGGITLAGLAVLAAGLFWDSTPLIVGGLWGFLVGGIATFAVAVRTWWTWTERISFTGVVAIVVIGLFLAGCLLPASFDTSGLLLLLLPLFGWYWEMAMPWSANVLLVLGLVSLGNGQFRKASLMGTVGAVLALAALLMFGNKLAVGYFLWLASFVTLAVGATVAARRTERDRVPTRGKTAPEGESDIGAAA